MSPEEERLIARLIGLRGYDRISDSEFLEAMGAGDGLELARSLLSKAVAEQDKDAVSMSMAALHHFGFSVEDLPILHNLAATDWHDSHEDVADTLDDIGSEESIPSMKHLAEWVPTHLQWDDARALSTKAVWGLAKMGTLAAQTALVELSQSHDPHVVQAATFQLRRLGVDR